MALILIVGLCLAPLLLLLADLLRVTRRADRFAGTARSSTPSPMLNPRDEVAAVERAEVMVEQRQVQLPFVGSDRRRPLTVPVALRHGTGAAAAGTNGQAIGLAPRSTPTPAANAERDARSTRSA